MKKFLSLFIISLFLVFYSCKEEKSYRIGVSQCSDDDWRAKINGEIMREAMFHPEAEVEILSANGDSHQQINDIKHFIEEGVDLLIVSPNEAAALTPIIREVYEANIPVLLFDRGIDGDSYTAFFEADNYDIGANAALYVANSVNEKPVILEVKGLEGSTPAIKRHNGFYDTLDSLGVEYDTIAVTGNWTADEAFQSAREALKQNRTINVIYAHNDRMAIAASGAAEELGLKPLVLGIDAAPEVGMNAVKQGIIDATFLYPTEGGKLLNTAIDILQNRPYERRIIIPSSTAVTRNNVDVLLLQNDELTTETTHLEQLKHELDGYWMKHNQQRALLIALVVILLLAFGIIYLVVKAVWTHKHNREMLARHNAILEEQKNELINLNQQLNAATQTKLMFFTNVSHELRTPITLIAEPIAELSKAPNLTNQQYALVRIANKNIRILRRLINQILDFRKYEHEVLSLSLTEVDLGKLIVDWASSFESLARSRHIDLSTEIVGDDLVMAVDTHRMERVFFNLVSNAFKYSPDNSAIKISCCRVDNNVVLRVADAGRGIAPEDLPNVFERFFQVDKSNPAGSGLGLTLVKAIVELHGGTVNVESELGMGTVFTVTLPVKHSGVIVHEVQKTIGEEDVNLELAVVEREQPYVDSNKPVLLVIDDNDDILNLVSRLLADDYNVLTAPNGRDGLKMATKYVPDIILCDVMMPVMNGLECCTKLKEELSTSHIPVLMLTACAMDEQQVEGLESGADAYVSKPFNADVLKAQIKNLIRNRKRIKNIFSSNDAVKHEAVTTGVNRTEENLRKGASNIDNDFYHRFVNLVNANMSDPDLSVDWLASEMGLARSQFYRKLKSITNFSPVELLRSLRLKHARLLLTTTEKSISEIGFDVGFSSAAYFSKCFHDEFGETPSQLRERLGH